MSVKTSRVSLLLAVLSVFATACTGVGGYEADGETLEMTGDSAMTGDASEEASPEKLAFTEETEEAVAAQSDAVVDTSIDVGVAQQTQENPTSSPLRVPQPSDTSRPSSETRRPPTTVTATAPATVTPAPVTIVPPATVTPALPATAAPAAPSTAAPTTAAAAAPESNAAPESTAAAEATAAPRTAAPRAAAPTTAAPTTAAPTTAAPSTAAPSTVAPTTAAPTTPPSGTPTPVGQSGPWQLVFAEDFDGSSLNTQIWEPGWFADSGFSPPVNGLEDSCFHTKQLSVSNGNLDIRIDEENDPGCKKRDGSRADFVGGLVNTRETFNFSYGYAESRINLSSSGGSLHNWPAFWHTGTDWPRTGEVDILEGLSGGQPCSYFHFANSSGQHGQSGSCVDWAEPGGWHVFAANWEPGKITYYYDGVEVFSASEGVTGDPHYLVVNYTTNEAYGIHPNTTMQVDYVRVWKSN